MMEFPWAYQKIEPTTWAYVSSLLMLALFFKFSRVWSVRNLDLFLIILLAPGLLLYDHGVTIERDAAATLALLGEPATVSLTSGGPLEPIPDSEVPATEDGTTEAKDTEAKDTEAKDTEDADNAGKDGAPPNPDTDPGSDPNPDEKLSQSADATDPAQDQDSDPDDDGSGFDPNQSASPATPEVAQETERSSTDPSNPESETDSANGESPATGEGATSGDQTPNPEASSQAEVRSDDDGTATVDQATRDPEVIEAILKQRARSRFARTLLHTSFLFLLSVAGVFVLRLLLDQVLVRRPLLENNLTVGGLTFLVCSFLTFQVANILISSPTESDLYGAETAAGILGDGQANVDVGHQEMGPAYPLIHLLPVIPTVIRDTEMSPAVAEEVKQEARNAGLVWVAKLVAIFSQLAIVAGLICLGRFQFSSLQNGMGMATLYLMLPYTAQMAGRVDHVLPGALLIWAAVLYRRPFWAGILFGMTMGLVYYPIFLLALWLSFYWEKGAARFTYGVGTILAVLVLSLLFFSTEERGFWLNLQGMFGVWLPRVNGLMGIWEFSWDPWFRLPILVAYVSLSISFVAWPVHKTYGTLLAYSAAMMVAVQFWHGYGGGLFMAWFLPLTIATFFRPNVQERVAKLDVY